jgi:hypothetical protein
MGRMGNDNTRGRGVAFALAAAALLTAGSAWADPEPTPLPDAAPIKAADSGRDAAIPPLAAPQPRPAAAEVSPVAPVPRVKPGEQVNVHGIGVAGSFATGTGLTYRRYFGNTSVQASCLAVITDRGSEALAFVGASLVQYVLIWHTPNARGLMPSTTALRLTGGAHYYLRKTTTTNFTFSQGIGTPNTSTTRESSVNLGAGLGAEFGGIVAPGFSLSLDLLLVAAIDQQGLSYILPLPQSALVYSW